jgi:transglutaminase superfamily protein
MMKVRVTTAPIPQGSEPIHLMVPIPPSTPEQVFVGLETDISHRGTEIQATNGVQRGLVFDVPASGAAEFIYSFDADTCGCIRKQHFRPVRSRYTNPSPELAAHVARLTAGCATDQEKLHVLVDFTAAIFDYDHPERPFNHGMDRIPLLMKLTKGSCTDVHGFLMSAMYSAGLSAAYYAGLFFPEGTESSLGLHCWCATVLDDRLTYWDVAHHLKFDRAPIEPGLNPIGGRRFAFGCGRGLSFDLVEIQALLGHFAHPMWVYADGSANAFGTKGQLLELEYAQ